jgi:hypothetical protein
MVVDNPGGVQLGSGMFEATVNSLSLVFVNSLSILRFKNYKYMFLLNSGIKYIY